MKAVKIYSCTMIGINSVLEDGVNRSHKISIIIHFAFKGDVSLGKLVFNRCGLKTYQCECILYSDG